jgi:hypothetical protein
MTSHAARLYALAAAILVFFLSWAAVAARPWANETAAAAGPDPRVAALQDRERALQDKAQLARRLLARQSAAASAAVAPVPAVTQAPPVQVASPPPVTVTRSS